MISTTMREIKIDAAGETFGRLASKIAILLQDKDLPAYNPRLEGQTKVVVVNVDKIRFTGKKMDEKVYRRHTGYLGGLKERKLAELFEKDPGKVLKMAVRKMLPKNKLRDRRLKRLVIK